MPEFICVQCFTCDTFQVQQVKKTNKFTCRMCQAPQSVRKVYAVSTQAKDVRYVVMELNAKLGETAQQPTSKPQKTMQPGAIASADQNQWSCFMSEAYNEAQDFPDADADASLDDFVTSLPDAGQRKRRQPGLSTCDGGRNKVLVCSGRTALMSAPSMQTKTKPLARAQCQSKHHTQQALPCEPGGRNAPVLRATQQKAAMPAPSATNTVACSYGYQNSKTSAHPAELELKGHSSHHPCVSKPSWADPASGSSTWSSFLSEEDHAQQEEQDRAPAYVLDDDSDDLLVTSFD